LTQPEGIVSQPEAILGAAKSILVIDWPTREVPEALANAGYTVIVHGGPEPDDYFAYEVLDSEVVDRRVGRPPERVDVVYTHRPLDELAGIVALAKELGATAVWQQSGLAGAEMKDPRGCWVPEEESRRARRIVESAGMRYEQDAYIADVARRLSGSA
jgi:predicted CoA-binding protein